jgi:addiction module HigA family antidote
MNRAPKKIGISPPHPGEFIRYEILNELGLNISWAAKALGVRRATLSDLVNGKTALSTKMALRIEKAFGIKSNTMLCMQAWFDAKAMRQRTDEIDMKQHKR